MAAGNWLTSAGIGDANIAVGPRTLHVALHESEKNQEIWGHPVIQGMLLQDLAMGNMAGFLGISPSYMAIGQGTLAATAEGTAASATNFSTSNASTVTPARKEFVRVLSDFARSVQGGMLGGGATPPDVASLVGLDMFRAYMNDFIDDIVALASSATNVIGTTGTALTWQDMQHGAYGFKDRGAARDRKLALISLKGAKDLADDAISLGGAVQMSQQVQQFLNNGATGAFLGTFFGSLDIYLNSELDTDSGDDLGIVIGPGGVISKHQRVPLPAEAETIIDMGVLTVEARRTGGSVTNLSAVSYNAVGIGEQGRLAAIRHIS